MKKIINVNYFANIPYISDNLISYNNLEIYFDERTIDINNVIGSIKGSCKKSLCVGSFDILESMNTQYSWILNIYEYSLIFNSIM